MGFNIVEYGFEAFYDVGVENAIWVFRNENTDDDSDPELYDDWLYVIETPYETHRTLTDNSSPIYNVYLIQGDVSKPIYTGLIPSDDFANELFIKLRMMHLPYVNREMKIQSILNKE